MTVLSPLNFLRANGITVVPVPSGVRVLPNFRPVTEEVQLYAEQHAWELASELRRERLRVTPARRRG